MNTQNVNASNIWIILVDSKKKSPLPFNFYYFPCFAIALIGLLNLTYLSISHYRIYTDIGYESFCAISRAINCDTVSQSSYSIFLGVPVALWGVLSFLFFICILLLAGSRLAGKERMWSFLFLISFGFSLYSLFLGYISTVNIQSFCIMCILGYLVNFTLLYYTWFINRRFGNKGLITGITTDIKFLKSQWIRVAPFMIAVMVFAVSSPFYFPKYWVLKEPTPDSAIRTGISKNGHPWIGAENPILVIEEFSDYMCFQCRKMHYYLRRLIQAHPEKIQLIHRHFPMDNKFNPIVPEPYHVGSGLLALMAIHAKGNEKFWEANDYFFILGSRREAFGTSVVAAKLGLSNAGLVMALNDKRYIKKLFNDVRSGLENGITATPTYLINGKLYEGRIPAKILTSILN